MGVKNIVDYHTYKSQGKKLLNDSSNLNPLLILCLQKRFGFDFQK